MLLICTQFSAFSHTFFIDVAEKHFQECFEENRNIVECDPHSKYGMLNKISKELGMGMSSIPFLYYTLFVW